MRAYRFVNDLGEAATAASEAVAEVADVSAAHRGGLGSEKATLDARVGTELIRQLARETANRDHERVTFAGRSVRVASDDTDSEQPGIDIGLVVRIDLPGYSATNVVIARVVHEARLRAEAPVEEPGSIRNGIETLLERTPATFLVLVSDDGTRVIPGRSVRALTEPMTRETPDSTLYGRALGRFIELLTEGFLGVSRLPPDPDRLRVKPGDERTLRTWGSRHDLHGVCALSVTATPSESATSLTPFLD